MRRVGADPAPREVCDGVSHCKGHVPGSGEPERHWWNLWIRRSDPRVWAPSAYESFPQDCLPQHRYTARRHPLVIAHARFDGHDPINTWQGRAPLSQRLHVLLPLAGARCHILQLIFAGWFHASIVELPASRRCPHRHGRRNMVRAGTRHVSVWRPDTDADEPTPPALYSGSRFRKI